MVVKDTTKRYYIIRTTKKGVEYKRYKCIDGWSKTPEGCWKFSRAGAAKIVKKYNEGCHYEQQPYPKRIHYNYLEVKEEC